MSILDIISSFVIKGAIILIIIQMVVSLQQILYTQSEKASVEQEMFNVSSIFSSDIRCVGSDSISTKPYFLTADASTIIFMIADSNSFGTPIKVSYSLTNSGSKFVLNRQINNGIPLPVGSNLKQFSLSYFDNLGALLTPLPLSQPKRLNIKSISALAQMEKITFSNDTVRATWQAQFYPQNL